jgi:tetratricopeptide (TPR) repeat protein
VRPLLPGTATCSVVVTSRSRLAGLVARDGATRIDLDVLSHDESVALLGQVIGAERMAAEPEAVARLAARCARLPLALRIAAARVTARPRVGLAELVTELATEYAQARLDAFEVDGDAAGQVRTIFSWSYQALRPEVARMWRLLGLHAGPQVAVYAAAALADVGPAQARRLLDTLAGVHLLKEVTPGRYELHDLLGAHAAERVEADETAGQREAAVARVLTWCLHAADAAAGVVSPTAWRRDLGQPSHPPPEFATPVAALGWCEAERENLLGAVAQAAAYGQHTVVCDLTSVLWWALYERRGYYEDIGESTKLALTAARQLRDRNREADALACLGKACRALGRYDEAATHAERALALYRETDDRHQEARTLNDLGLIRTEQGRPAEAIALNRQASTRYRETGDRSGAAGALLYLGYAFRHLRRLDEALAHHRRALAIFREVDEQHGAARALSHIGQACLDLGRAAEAVADLEQAAALYRQTGDWNGEAGVLSLLGPAYRELGRSDDAVERLRQARSVLDKLAGHASEGAGLAQLGVLYWRIGQYDTAVTHLQHALPLLRELDDQRDEANVLLVLGASYRELRQFDEAASHLEQALGRYREIGDVEGQAEALYSLGLVCWDRGASWRRRRRVGAAMRYYRQALVRYQRIGDRYRQGLVWIRLAAALDRRSFSLAERCLRRAETMFTELGDQASAGHVRSASRRLRRSRWATVASLLGLFGVVGAVWLPASAGPPAVGGRAGFVWAYLPTASSYRPAEAGSPYQYDSADATDIAISREAVGRYLVRFGGLATPGGVAHATAYGPDSTFCSVAGWAPDRGAEVVRVWCFSSDGRPADSRFVANFAAGSAGTGRLSYLLAEPSTGDRYQLSARYRYDSTGQAARVERRAIGRYRVFVPASVGIPASLQFYQVTADRVAAHCKLSALPSRSGVQEIACRSPRGEPVDARFSLSFSWRESAIGRIDRRYGYRHSWITGYRIETGYYVAWWSDLGIDAGQVVAYAVGDSDAYCHVGRRTALESALHAVIRCWSAATQLPADAAYVTGMTR